jgi:hypothetical protein
LAAIGRSPARRLNSGWHSERIWNNTWRRLTGLTPGAATCPSRVSCISKPGRLQHQNPQRVHKSLDASIPSRASQLRKGFRDADIRNLPCLVHDFVLKAACPESHIGPQEAATLAFLVTPKESWVRSEDDAASSVARHTGVSLAMARHGGLGPVGGEVKGEEE